MSEQRTITVTEISSYHSVDTSFIYALGEHGLITLIRVNDDDCIEYDELGVLERCVHLRYELDINIEGIEAIHHLLNKINHLQNEIRILKNSR